MGSCVFSWCVEWQIAHGKLTMLLVDVPGFSSDSRRSSLILVDLVGGTIFDVRDNILTHSFLAGYSHGTCQLK